MNFGDIGSLVNNIASGVGGIVGGLYLLAVTCGVAGVVILSILMMFSDEQAAQRYKRWRSNIIKAVVVALLIAWVFTIIKGIFNGYWGKSDFNDLV